MRRAIAASLESGPVSFQDIAPPSAATDASDSAASGGASGGDADKAQASQGEPICRTFCITGLPLTTTWLGIRDDEQGIPVVLYVLKVLLLVNPQQIRVQGFGFSTELRGAELITRAQERGGGVIWNGPVSWRNVS